MGLCIDAFLHQSDAALIAQITDGDGEALVFLLAVRCGPALKYLCSQNRASRLELMDLVQDVALRLIANDYKALRDFDGKNRGTGRACGLERYVFVIARNHIQRLNKRAMTEYAPSMTPYRTIPKEEPDGSLETPTTGASSEAPGRGATPRQVRREIDWTSAFTDDNGHLLEVPGDGYSKEQLRIEVMDAIMMLDDSRERFVLIEYKIRGYSPDEVAAALGTTEGNVYTICSRAQKKLRAILLKGGSSHA